MLKKLGKGGSGIEILKEKYARYKTIKWIEVQYAKMDAAAEKGNLMIDGKRVGLYVGDKVELGAAEKRSIVERGIGVGSDGELYISKEALEHFNKTVEKGANDNIIKPYTRPNTGYKSKVSGKVVVESSVLDKYFGGKIKLTDHEGRSWNGHTNKLHVGLKVDDLKARIANDPTKKIATTYPNEKVAESVISEVIVKNEAEIIKWFEKSNPFSKKEFGAKLGIYTGYGINKAGEKINMNKATVWLKKWMMGV